MTPAIGERRGVDKDTRTILRALRNAGFRVDYTRSGHPRVFKAGRLVTIFPGTTSDYRARRNSLSQLKRAGFNWPPHRPHRRNERETP